MANGCFLWITSVSFAVSSILALISRPAFAADVEVSSTTAAQGYSLRSPWGDPVLLRRRFLQTLGLAVTNIGSEGYEQGKAQVTFRLQMRLDADFGIRSEEYHRATQGFIPGVQQAPVDLMVGYLDARNLAQGLLSMRLGRQYVVDPLGWWSFDGALLRAELPIHLAIETYGGFEQRGGLPLSTPRFEREGVWRGDRTGFDATSYPEFLKASVAPAHGLVVETLNLPIVHGRLAYRRVWNTGQVATSPFPSTLTGIPPSTTGMRMSSERLAASADAALDDVGAVRTGAIFDVYVGRFSSLYASLDAFPLSWLSAGLDADRVVPSFDADSIWNWFDLRPMSTVTARANAAVVRGLDLGTALGVRKVDASADSSDQGSSTSGGGSLATVDKLARAFARYRYRDGVAGTNSVLDTGHAGRRLGADVYAERWFDNRFGVSGRLSLYDWRDDQRVDRSATSFSYVVAGMLRTAATSNVRVEWEHDANRLVGQRYRVLAVLQVLVNK